MTNEDASSTTEIDDAESDDRTRSVNDTRAVRKHFRFRSTETWKRAKGRLPVALSAIFASAAVATAAGLFFIEYRPDQQVSAAIGKSVVSAASDGTVALLSYSPETFDRDFASAKTHLTGDFLSYYGAFGEQVLRPAANGKGVKTMAMVTQAAVSELHPTSAVVLEFVNQTTTTKEKPQPALAASSVVVKLAKVSGKWLISSFDPTPI